MEQQKKLLSPLKLNASCITLRFCQTKDICSFECQDKSLCFVMCAHVTPHNSRQRGGQLVHPGASAQAECQSKPRCCDCCNMAELDAGERSACAGASVADGRPRLVMQQCTVVTLTIHFTLQAASAGQTRGMGAIPHKPGGTHPPRAAVSLPLVYSRCQ